METASIGLAITPPDGGDATSEFWDPSTNRRFQRDMVDVVAPQQPRDTSLLVEPPSSIFRLQSAKLAQLFTGFDTAAPGGGASAAEPTSYVAESERLTDMRPAPPTLGIDQTATIIEVVCARSTAHYGKDHKTNIFVTCDGVYDPGNKSDGVTSRHWIPRFREQNVRIGNATNITDKRVVAPLMIGVRVEDGARPPDDATVRVRQRIVDNGVVLLDWTEISSFALKPYSTSGHVADVVSIPYPAAFSRPPTLRIIDNAKQSKYEAEKQKDKRSKVSEILDRTAQLVTNSGGIKTSLDDKSSYLGQVLRLATIAVVPSLLYRFYLLSYAVYDASFNEFDKELPDPIVHDLSLQDVVTSVRKIIAECESSGAELKNRKLSPMDLRDKKLYKEAALWDYLVFGDLARKDKNRVNDGLVGNRLDSRAMDAFVCAKTRVEHQVIVTVDGRPHVFDSVMSNALDAGWIMSGYNDLRTELMSLTEKFCTPDYNETWSETLKKWVTFGSAPYNLAVVKERFLTEIVGKTVEPIASRRTRQERTINYKFGGAKIPAELKNLKIDASTYEKITRDQAGLYRKAMGLPLQEITDTVDDGMLRWRDVFMPIFPERFDRRLGAYDVPTPRDKERKVPALVRRLPHIVVFHSAAAITQSADSDGGAALPTRGIPCDPLNNRTDAKSAVAATRRAWSRVNTDMASCVWTLEPGLRNAHPIVLYADADDVDQLKDAANAPVVHKSLDYMWLSSIYGRALPDRVAIAVDRAESGQSKLQRMIHDAAGSALGGDADVMRTHKLAPSVASWSALLAMANVIVYVAIERGFHIRIQDIMRSMYDEARHAAKFTATVIKAACSHVNSKRGVRALLDENDPFFRCVRGAGHAHAMLKQLGAWSAAQREIRDTPDAHSYANFERLWSAKLASQAQAFASALQTLSSTSDEFQLDKWPFMGLQTVVVDSNSLVSSAMPYVHGTHFHNQLSAASNSYLRVRMMLDRANETISAQDVITSMAYSRLALLDTVASRPIVLRALAHEDALSFVHVALLKATTFDEQTKQMHARWKVPLVDAALMHRMHKRLRRLCRNRQVNLIDRIQTLSIDDVDDTPLNPISPNGTADSLMHRKLDETGVWVAPVCGLGLCGPRSISSTHTLEDSVVWLEVFGAQLQMPLHVQTSANAIAVSSEWFASTPETVEHPYVFATSPSANASSPVRGSFCMASRTLPRFTNHNAPVHALPSSVYAAVLELSKPNNAKRDEQHRQTEDINLLRERTRTLLWLTDRFVQLHILLVGETGGGPNDGKMPVHVVHPPTTWGDDSIMHATIALALARAMCVCAFQVQFDVRLVADVDDEGFANAVAPARAIASLNEASEAASRASGLRAVPLAELCHALAAVLT